MALPAEHPTIASDDRPVGAPPGSFVSIQRPSGPFGKALEAAGASSAGLDRLGSETPSEEDYDQNVRPTLTQNGLRHRLRATKANDRPGILRSDSGVHITPENDKLMQEFLSRSSELADGSRSYPKAGFGDLVFTQQFSAFDRNNIESSQNPFTGFYNLFWLAVTLFVCKISAENWRLHGSPLGANVIMSTMFSRDVKILLISDGIMCALTGVTWVLQVLTFKGFMNWNRRGWIIQHVWQSSFIGGVIGWTLVRDWPWTHTVFFVMHGLVMLMKQHSYAFYNGYLSTIYEHSQFIVGKLKQLESTEIATGAVETSPAVSSISTSHLDAVPSAEAKRHSAADIRGTERTDIERIAQAIASRKPLSDEQVQLFERIMEWEVAARTDELKGTASDTSKAYPANLGFMDHYKWIPLPTVVYEIEYPTSSTISWPYVAEKLVAMVGVIFVMIQISEYSIYPVVLQTVQMKKRGDSLSARFSEFPWMLLDLMFPFMMEYLLVWYLIWEIILNILAELTYFADRRFYDAWWNSVSWDQFAREWNRPVHLFLLRHVYHSSISSLKINKRTATLITFFFSSCIHELVMWCIFKKLRGYLLMSQMSQLPLVALSRTRYLKGRRTLGNLLFWLGLFTGPGLLCSLYLIL